MIVKSEKQIDFILDLYNKGNIKVYTYNNGDDPLTCGEWLYLNIGMCLCYAIGEIQISDYKVSEE
jgi:hypothetical protein